MTKTDAFTFPVTPPTAPMTTASWTYTYDSAGRLETADDGTTRTYGYDLQSNRNAVTVDAQDRATQIGNPGDADETTYAYDAHGNVTSRTVGGVVRKFNWDSQGSLLSVTDAAGPPANVIVSYDVDAKGRRVGRRVGGNLTHQWMYDGQLRIVGEVVYASPVRYRVYGYVPERHLPVVMVEKTSTNVETTYRLFGDHLGSLRAVVRTSDGVAVQWMGHGPWGELEGQAVAAGFERVPFGFAGGTYEDLTGLVRFGAREYDPRTGRWLSKDEAQFGGGENFYLYSDGDPIGRIDPTGTVGRVFASMPIPQEASSDPPVGGVCTQYFPGTPQWCRAQVAACINRCSDRVRRSTDACRKFYLEKTGETRDDICSNVATDIAASCFPTCDAAIVCSRWR